MMRYDAVVVGAGPAGATAALLLARAGWSVAVVERATYPRGKVCGEYVTPAALDLLGRLDVPDVAGEAGPPVKRMALWTDRVAAAAAMPAQPRGNEAYGRAVGRELCDARLLQHAALAGAHVLQPWRAHALRGAAGAFECELASGSRVRTLRARCMIAAHGSWEKGLLPTQARHAPGQGSALLGFKTYFEDVALEDDLLPLVFFPGGYAGLVHGAGGRVNFSCCIRRDALGALRARHTGRPAGEALLSGVKAANRHARDALASARRAAPWSACGPLRPGTRLHWPEGVYAIGNAAGEAHPVIGEGISMALQSAVLLAAALTQTREGDWPGAAARYRGQWQQAFAGRLRASACYAQLALRPGWADAVASVASRAPLLLALGMRWSGKGAAIAC